MSRPTLLAVFHTQLSSSFYFSFLLRVCLPTRISVFLLHRPVVVTLYLQPRLPAGPGLTVIGWLMLMSQLNVQHFPFSSLSHQQVDQSQPEESEQTLMGRSYRKARSPCACVILQLDCHSCSNYHTIYKLLAAEITSLLHTITPAVSPSVAVV